MSIESVIEDHCEGGSLFEITPSLPTDPIERFVFVTPEINQKLIGTWKNDKEERMWGKAKALMDHYISGRIVSVGTKNKKFHMTHLTPYRDGVWGMRPQGLRIIGQFAKKDVFVGLNWEKRSDLIDLPQWKQVARKCKAQWRGYFYTHQPLTSENHHDYITNIILN